MATEMVIGKVASPRNDIQRSNSNTMNNHDADTTCESEKKWDLEPNYQCKNDIQLAYNKDKHTIIKQIQSAKRSRPRTQCRCSKERRTHQGQWLFRVSQSSRRWPGVMERGAHEDKCRIR